MKTNRSCLAVICAAISSFIEFMINENRFDIVENLCRPSAVVIGNTDLNLRELSNVFMNPIQNAIPVMPVIASFDYLRRRICLTDIQRLFSEIVHVKTILLFPFCRIIRQSLRPINVDDIHINPPGERKAAKNKKATGKGATPSGAGEPVSSFRDPHSGPAVEPLDSLTSSIKK